jgi:hypothetical protein
MSDARKLLARRGDEAWRATKLFFQVVGGESAAPRKKVAVQPARERERDDRTSIVDAEFEEETS